MDRQKIILTGIIAFSLAFQSFAETEYPPENPPLPSISDWSPFQGNLTWTDARDRCQNLGMRLPTVEDAQSGLASGKLKRWDWRYDGIYHYWTSSELGDLHSYIVEIHSGRTEPRSKKHLFGVRCIHLQDEK